MLMNYSCLCDTRACRVNVLGMYVLFRGYVDFMLCNNGYGTGAVVYARFMSLIIKQNLPEIPQMLKMF